ncbi:MAG: TIGR03560 family F420-dependent LLM class oxidoreductase [Acidimicrobiales bacterium]
MRLPVPALVVLVGPSGAGKSFWAAANFRPDQVVSSDALRGLVGEGEHDQRASKDAFDVLDLVIERRLKRKLLTVVDSLGLDAKTRAAWRAMAEQHGVPCVAVAFETAPGVCRARNKARTGRPVPAKVLADQIKRAAAVGPQLDGEGFFAVHRTAGDDTVVLVPIDTLDAPRWRRRQKEQPVALDFQLQIPSFTWEGGPAELAGRLGAVGRAAEEAGFTGIWVMDHFLQIPQVGPEWHEMLDSYTALSFLAAHTSTVTLGAMVTGVTYRNIAHLGKIVATLDVLSGGRAACGLGAAWFEREHKAYGWTFPPLAERYRLLEDALQLLPLMWGPGSPSFEGATVSVPEAVCYPRPLQEHVPILVGGGGERKTLRLVARFADACNLFGDADTVRHKVAVLHRHCADVGRDPADVRVTHLSTALTGENDDDLAAIVERLRGDRMTVEAFVARTNGATIDDHVGRFRKLADAGVQTAIVSLPDLSDTGPVERFAGVIAAFAS